MKIAFLAFNTLPKIGGTQVFTYNLIQSLANNSHEVHLFLPYHSYKEFKSLQIERNFKIFPILFYEGSFTKRFPAILYYSLLARQLIFKYDVWQIIGAYPAGYIAHRLTPRVPTVLRSHGDDIQKDEKLNYGIRLNSNIEKKIKITLSKMTSLVALTPTVRDCYLELGVNNDKIVEIPNAIKLSRFKQNVDRNVIRKQIGVRDDETLILTTGRYHLKKGYEYIPEAANILKNMGIKFRWLIIGRGLNELVPLIQKWQVNDVIILKSKIWKPDSKSKLNKVLLPSDELIKIYKSADIYVFPSLLETFGMVLIEAMAAGLPVITTNAPGCCDIVTNNYNGLVSECKNVQSLVKNIKLILEDSILREKLILNSKRFVEKYDWQFITEKYEKLYKNLCNYSAIISE